MKTTIQNEFLTVTVDTHGAEVVSVKRYFYAQDEKDFCFSISVAELHPF